MPDIFISYRREGGSAQAILMYERLIADGYDVFLDINSLGPGRFDDALPEEIKHCTDFLLILSPNALDRCNDPKDLVRREIEAALNFQKNIIPIFLKGFEKPADLPQWLEDTLNHNGIDMTNHEYLNAAMERLKTKRLQSKPSIQNRLKKNRQHLRYDKQKPKPQYEEPEKDDTVCPVCKSVHLKKDDRMMDLIRFSNGCNRLYDIIESILSDVIFLFALLLILYKISPTRDIIDKVYTVISTGKENILPASDLNKELLKLFFLHLIAIIPFSLINGLVSKIRAIGYRKSLENNIYKVKYICTDCNEEFTVTHDAQTLIERINATPREKTDIAYPIAIFGVILIFLCIEPLRIFLLVCTGLILVLMLVVLCEELYRVKKGIRSRRELNEMLYMMGMVFLGLPDITPESASEITDEEQQNNNHSPRQ